VRLFEQFNQTFSPFFFDNYCYLILQLFFRPKAIPKKNAIIGMYDDTKDMNIEIAGYEVRKQAKETH